MSKNNMFVFFTKTGRENRAAKEIKMFFTEKEVKPLCFSTERFFRKQGKVNKEIKPMFPGYLFVTSPMCDEEFVIYTREFVRKSSFLIKLLKYGDSEMAAISQKERNLLENLFQGEECIKTSSGYIQGEKIIITDGPFMGKESIIKSINRHKMQATIELQILGETREVTIRLEIIARYGNEK